MHNIILNMLIGCGVMNSTIVVLIVFISLFLFICACGSADVAHENIICDNAKKTGATILLITPSAKGHILEIADKVIRIPATAYKAVYNSEDEYVPTAQMMGNQFEQALLVFFDVIVMMLSEEMGISKEEMEARHRNIE